MTNRNSNKHEAGQDEQQMRIDLAACYRLVALYGWDDGVESNALEVHIHHLRRKLDSKLIKTVRGIGYLFTAP